MSQSTSTPTPVRPETEERVDRLCQAAWNGRISPEAFRGLVLATLKEQDKATRHACAEAICHMEGDGYGAVSCREAEQACMNAQAI